MSAFQIFLIIKLNSFSFFRSELVCKVKYQNNLPDIPFDPKFLEYPFDSQRFVNYKPTSLERNYKFELQVEHDMGIFVDLVLPDAYALPPEDEIVLDPKDEKLLTFYIFLSILFPQKSR